MFLLVLEVSQLKGRCIDWRNHCTNWNNHLEIVWPVQTAMWGYGYRQAQSDYTLFIKHSPQGKAIAFIDYVDDNRWWSWGSKHIGDLNIFWVSKY